jgi:hypothetical protein
MSLIRATSPKQAWVPLYVHFSTLFPTYLYTHIFLTTGQFLSSIGIGLLYTATVFPVLAPLPPSWQAKALAFLVFVRNFGNILGITIGASFFIVLNHKRRTDQICHDNGRFHSTHKRARQEAACMFSWSSHQAVSREHTALFRSSKFVRSTCRYFCSSEIRHSGLTFRMFPDLSL